MKNETKKQLFSPFDGESVPLSSLPDPVFSGGMLGEGVAVIPSGGRVKVLAPCDCEIRSISETRHAINLISEDGAEILIHIGLDTYELRGEGFTEIRKPGDRLLSGNAILEVDFDLIRKMGKSPATPVILTNGDMLSGIKGSFGEVVSGETVLEYECGEVEA